MRDPGRAAHRGHTGNSPSEPVDRRSRPSTIGLSGAREDGVSADIDATAQCWATAHRVGVKIAALPAAARETAFDGTERCLRAAGSELGVAGEQLDRIVDLQMWAIRQIVADIDANDGPATPEVVVSNSDAPPPHADLIADC
jgi:hypothetical protein